jgi:hypothetical protein
MIGILISGIFIYLRGVFEWGNLIGYGSIAMDLPFWLLISIVCYYYSQYQPRQYKVWQ